MQLVLLVLAALALVLCVGYKCVYCGASCAPAALSAGLHLPYVLVICVGYMCLLRIL